MGDDLFRNRYRISLARADRIHYLGEIENGEITLFIVSLCSSSMNK